MSGSAKSRLVVSLMAGVAAVALHAAPAAAGTFRVNSTADLADAHPGDGICNGDVSRPRANVHLPATCTLRAAIQEANASGGANTITLPGEYFRLASALPTITGALTIDGAGWYATTIAADAPIFDSTASLDLADLAVIGSQTVLDVADATLKRVIVQAYGSSFVGLSSSGGNIVVTDSRIDGAGAGNSVGIRIAGGSLTFTGGDLEALVYGIDARESATTVTNTSVNGGPSGVGIAARGGVVAIARTDVAFFAIGIAVGDYGAAGLVQASIQASWIRANGVGVTDAASGLSAPLTIRQTSVVANHGGGILDEGGALTITNSTISDNSGFGIRNAQNVLTPYSLALGNVTIAANGSGLVNDGDAAVVNSIVADNTSADCTDSVPPTSLGHNILGVGCTFAAPSDRAVDPMLDTLRDNGGPVETRALLPGSPAIDAADPLSCPPTDQRGVVRPAGGGCDIGAFEFSSAADVAVALAAVPAAAKVGDTVTYTATVTDKGPDAATLVALADALPPGMQLVSATSSSGSCSSAGASVICAIGALANHASAKITIVAKALAAGTLTDTASVKAGQIDPDRASNSAQTTVVVSPVVAVQAGLSARLVRARVTRVRLHYRVLATLVLNEAVHARGLVTRGSHRLVSRNTPLAPGTRTLTILLPRATKRGTLLLRLFLRDAAAHTVTLRVPLRAR